MVLEVVQVVMCKCVHVGHGNEDVQYTMGGTVPNTTLKEKGLVLIISADTKASKLG